MSQTRPAHKKSVVLFLGKQFYHEGVSSSLRSRGLTYDHYNLVRVSHADWNKKARRIEELKQAGRLLGVVLYMPTPVILQAVKPGYDEAWEAILTSIQDIPTIAFLYSDNLAREFRPRDRDGRPETLESLQDQLESDPHEFRTVFIRHAIRQLGDAERYRVELDKLLDSIFSSSIQVAPFSARTDVTARLEEFLEELEERIFLRLYVANDRFQSEQIAGFLRVFERYLRQVESQDFRIETRKTGKGTVYVFCGSQGADDLKGMDGALARFDAFMKMCKDNPGDAIKLLEASGVNATNIPFLVNKYARDFQRLVIDSKHEFDQRALMLSQRMELDLLEFAADATPMLSSAGPSLILDVSGNFGPINLNFGDKISVADAVDNNMPAASREIEQALYNAFDSLASRIEAIQLKSNLDQLKDSSASTSEKNSAGQRIRGFLYKTAAKIGNEVATQGTKAMLDYITSLAGS